MYYTKKQGKPVEEETRGVQFSVQSECATQSSIQVSATLFIHSLSGTPALCMAIAGIEYTFIRKKQICSSRELHKSKKKRQQYYHIRGLL